MRDITLCHPQLQFLAGRLLEECRTGGLSIAIGESYRTVLEQEELYAQGRTRPGKIVTNARGITYDSFHQWGTAFDFYRNDGRGAYNEEGQFFEKVGAVGKSLGLEWGGGWKSIKDKPHFQLPDWGSGTAEIKKLYKDPEEFRKTWTTKAPGWQKEQDGWRYYIGTSGTYIKNDWYQDKGKWYWFNDLGIMVHDDWIFYKEKWYYLNTDGCMAHSQWVIWKNELYRMTEDGAMFEGEMELKTDEEGALKKEAAKEASKEASKETSEEASKEASEETSEEVPEEPSAEPPE